MFGRGQALPLLRAAWPQAVGAELARRTHVEALVGRTLRVRVPDARWRKVLHRMQPEILARLRLITGELAPANLGFSEGGVAEASEPPRTYAAIPEAQAPLPDSVLERLAVLEDAELRERFAATAARYLARARRRAGA
jgi:hypothetical protein